ncbi:hypothetical protein Syn7502_00229 [Synechococcus sp. PCC 7502]|uniref:hypothetical protein n=1 Tax=Synechococcus sp. PCC 7502 TaxID=1173263 RepID=UPI00029F80C1|nr:hypothetical protein [Synechococcus sp. PCC 7502]AFY72396.1 hypothetical protein Syn7502_00229 [Synechococcus sp. PCC 7502]
MNNQVLPRQSHNALAVIMISGAVDLEPRLQTDRQWTVSLMERDLNFMKEQCAYYEGQVLQSTELGVIANFSNAVEALKCALSIQKTLITAASTMQSRDVLGHSIGIHQGDLVADGGKVGGNGITIANQIQLDANWGTIHISESIYHQVNKVMELIINYVGERYLQKIYQVIPKGFTSSLPVITPSYAIDIDSIPINDEFSNKFIEPDWYLFDQVVNSLESNHNILEIKRLLLYICLNKWESDQLKLEKLNLKGLVQELIEPLATLAQLKSLIALITDVTQTVDSEYGVIGKTIIQAINKLYARYQSEPQDIYDEVIQSWEDVDKDTTRIKRLIFYLCRCDLPSFSTEELTLKAAIQKLQGLYPSLETLRPRMKQAIAVIRKPEYSDIVDVVIDDLSAIFPARSLSLSPTLTPTTATVSTNADYADFTPLIEPVHAISFNLNQNLDQADKSAISKTENKTEQSIDAEIADLELFDLRLEIIKYLSPLRAKILIFSALNNEVAESTNESVSAIRTYELDDLLRDLFYAFKSSETLEIQLKNTARQFRDVDEYEQAVSVIMNAMLTVYKKLGIGV